MCSQRRPFPNIKPCRIKAAEKFKIEEILLNERIELRNLSNTKDKVRSIALRENRRSVKNSLYRYI